MKIIMPEDWSPETPDDLVGPSKNICKAMVSKALRLREKADSKCVVMFCGDPGIGKTEIARFMAGALVERTENREVLSGRQVTHEMALQWLRLIRQRNLFSGYQCRVIEEIDTVCKGAQDILLKVLDDMHGQQAIIGTSNMDMSDLSERFQTRFQVVKVNAPEPMAVANFIRSKWSFIPQEEIAKIAQSTNGNVRAAIKDAQTWIDANWDAVERISK